jgi:ATP-binding cassette subfamily B protein
VGGEVSAEPLIGVDDMETPYWAQGYEKVVQASLREVATAVPRTMALVVGWAWRAAPGLTLLTAALQLLTGAVQAFGLLATANVFAPLLAAGPTPERVAAALPALAVVIAAYAGRGLLDAAEGATQAALAPRVQREAEDELYAVLVGVDLVAFDESDFTQLVERVTQGAPSRVRAAVRETSDLTALAVSMCAAVLTAGILQPLLAPTVLLAAAPQAWAQVKGAKLAFDSWLRTSSRARRLDVVSELVSRRENAAEVRAFTTQEVLLGEHRRIADDLLTESIRVAHRQNRATTAGRALSGIGTAIGYVVLGLLLYAGAMPLALAGTAVLAMRAASSAIVNSMFQVSQLYESGFTLELYRTLIRDAGARSRPPGRTALRGDPTEITLDGVSFRYPGHDERALADVSLTLRRGQVIALVGENGSGKSTLAKLLTGLYLPEVGTVAWDGVDTADVDAEALHERVAVVLQDPLHWPMTAANNVRIGCLPTPTMPSSPMRPPGPGPTSCSPPSPTARPRCCRGSSRRAVTCRAGSGSGFRWPAGSTGTRRWSSPTSPPRRWTPVPSTPCSPRCAGWAAASASPCWSRTGSRTSATPTRSWCWRAGASPGWGRTRS